MQTDHIKLNEPFTTLWAGQDPFAAAAALTGHTVRDIAGRRTLRFSIKSIGYYLKLQRGIGWTEIAGDLLRLRRPVLGAGNEWRAIQACHRLGIDTLTAVAYGERGRGPAHRTSFLITEAIEPAIDLDEYTRPWRHTPPPVAHKRALIRQVATIAHKLHTGGLNHRDFYLCHFLLRTGETNADTQHTTPPQLALIDLHRAQLRTHTPPRWRNKDLAALYFSALQIGLTRRDKLRFLLTYFPGSLRDTLQREQALLTHLETEAVRLQARYTRKFAHLPDLQR